MRGAWGGVSHEGRRTTSSRTMWTSQVCGGYVRGGGIMRGSWVGVSHEERRTL